MPHTAATAASTSVAPSSGGHGVRLITMNRPHPSTVIVTPPPPPITTPPASPVGGEHPQEIAQQVSCVLRVAAEGMTDLQCLSRLVHSVAQHAAAVSEADGWAVVALGRERLYVWSDAGSGSLAVPENTLSEAAVPVPTEGDRPFSSSYHFHSLREYQHCRAVAALFPSMELAERAACDVAASLIIWSGYVTGVVILFSKNSQRLSIHASAFAENAAVMLRGIIASAFCQPPPP